MYIIPCYVLVSPFSFCVRFSGATRFAFAAGCHGMGILLREHFPSSTCRFGGTFMVWSTHGKIVI